MSGQDVVRHVNADMARIRQDHWKVAQDAEDAFWDPAYHRLGTSAKQGFRSGWWKAVKWLLNAQHAMDDLTEGQLLAEIRKGAGSIFWPLLSPDPTMIADCPRCGHAVVIDKEGLCPGCAFEFEEEN